MSALFCARPPKNSFPASYDESIIAQAGATRETLGAKPVNSPEIPSSCSILTKIREVVIFRDLHSSTKVKNFNEKTHNSPASSE